MSKSRKKEFEKILKEAGEQASSRAQEAIKRGVTFEYFKNIADNMVIPEYGSVLAGNVKTNNVKKVSKLKKSK
jgi:hypothetical protein